MSKQGDIVLIHFPHSDLSSSKKRPALIISNEKINKTQDRICMLITSMPNKEGIEIKEEYLDKKLPFKSWIKPHRIFTINKNLILKKLCKGDFKLQEIVIEKLNTYLE